MVLVPPVSQFSNNYTISTSLEVRTNFTSHISYALPVQFFDNSPESQSIFMINDSKVTPSSGYRAIYCSNGQICGYGAYSNVSLGIHLVRYNMPATAFSLYVYGFAREISYGYPAGFRLEPIGGKFLFPIRVNIEQNIVL